MIHRKGSKLYLGKEYHNLLGALQSKKVFVVHVKKPEKHFFVKGQGYPLNLELLRYLENIGVKYIVLPELSKTHGFRVFTTNIGKYLMGDKIFEGGFEGQMVVPLNELQRNTRLEQYKQKFMRLMYHL